MLIYIFFIFQSTNAVLLTVLSLITIKEYDMLVALALRNQEHFLNEDSSHDRDNYKKWLYAVKDYLPVTFPNLLKQPEWQGLVEKVCRYALLITICSCFKVKLPNTFRHYF